jgi:hypothetical protein
VVDTLLADKSSHASDRVIDRLNAEGKTALIGLRHNRKRVRTYNTELYKARPLIEYFFAKRLRITRYSLFCLTKKL